jgi:hypothetical protein
MKQLILLVLTLICFSTSVKSQVNVYYDTLVFDRYLLENKLHVFYSVDGNLTYPDIVDLVFHRKHTLTWDTIFYYNKMQSIMKDEDGRGIAYSTRRSIYAFSDFFVTANEVTNGLQTEIIYCNYTTPKNGNIQQLLHLYFPSHRPPSDSIFSPVGDPYYRDFTVLNKDSIMVKTYVPRLPEIVMLIPPMSGTGLAYPNFVITDEVKRMYIEQDTIIDIYRPNWDASPLLDPKEMVEHPITHKQVPRSETYNYPALHVSRTYTKSRK